MNTFSVTQHKLHDIKHLLKLGSTQMRKDAFQFIKTNTKCQ
jgi:hypothetical protein